MRISRHHHPGTLAFVPIALLAMAGAAWAQWTPVPQVPATELFSLWANADTIVAGADTAAYISTNAGASWSRSSKPAPGVTAIEALWVRNHRLYAGTFGQGVFISDDLGATWSPFNDGLVGGPLGSQLFVVDFQVRDHRLYAATAGAGVYVRDLATVNGWQPFGEALEPNQASNVNGLTLAAGRLLVSAGANGMVFLNDPGSTDWAISNLDNVGIHAGLQAMSSAWTGSGWVVGTNAGVFRSVAGQEPWTRIDPGLGPLFWVAFATNGRHLFAAFDTNTQAVIEDSGDDGATWQNAEAFPDRFVMKMAVSAGVLYAARDDGLWRRTIGTASIPGAAAQPLRFALLGRQPFEDAARLRFDLPVEEAASIDVFDAMGRRAAPRIESVWSSGPHEVTLDARELPPGVYAAVLAAGKQRAVVRLVHVR